MNLRTNFRWMTPGAFLALGLSMVTSGRATILDLTAASSTAWRGVMKPGTTNFLTDEGGRIPGGIGDQQTGQTVSDFVGSTTTPTFYLGSGTIGGVQHIGFRVRLNSYATQAGTPNPGALKQITYVGFDFDANGVADMFVGADMQPQQDTSWSVVITDAGSGLNTSPNTTTIPYAGPPSNQGSPTNGAIYRQVTGYNGAANSTAALINYQVVADGSPTFDGDVDAYLSFAVPFASFVAAIKNTTVMGSNFVFDANTEFRITANTSNQQNALNQDAMNALDVSFNFSAPINTSGIVVPEVSTVTMLGALLTPLVLRRPSRRRGLAAKAG